jgi:hypothetical protein
MTPPDAGPHPVDRTVLRLSGPEEVLEALPYLVGFTPRASVVLIAVSGGRRQVVLTARVDLADHPLDALGPAWPAASREGANAVLVVVYDDAVVGVPLPHTDLVAGLVARSRAHGLAVPDALCVGATRFWSYLCDTPACCPAEGRPLPERGAVAAELVFCGQAVVGSREDLCAEIAVDGQRARRIASLLERGAAAGVARWSVAAQIAYLDALLDADSLVEQPDEDLACAVQALRHPAVREAHLLDRGPGAERAWAALATVTPAPWRALPLTLLAVCRYRRGDGARANVATEAAVAADPHDELARLVGQALAAGVSPQALTGPLDTAARRRREAAAGDPRRPGATGGRGQMSEHEFGNGGAGCG